MGGINIYLKAVKVWSVEGNESPCTRFVSFFFWEVSIYFIWKFLEACLKFGFFYIVLCERDRYLGGSHMKKSSY